VQAPGDLDLGVAEVGDQIRTIGRERQVDDRELLIGQHLGTQVIPHATEDRRQLVRAHGTIAVAHPRGERL
jgi:hypothetical protein